MSSPDLVERVEARINRNGPLSLRKGAPGHCWTWRGAPNCNGYGRIRISGQDNMAHRVTYELANGPIPAGLQVDHLCRNRMCVRPSHLEAVTQRINLLRGHTIVAREAVVTHCPQEHPYDELNTYHYRGMRYCRACNRERSRTRSRSMASRRTALTREAA